ncbi:MAG: TRAP transporter small permease [Burkholderiaceae bacterium]|nr:TRAP transporter small permease [Burkholderiaceae bacterium]
MSAESDADLVLDYSTGFTRRIEQGLDILSAFFLALMMLITTADVIGRYLFHAPLYGAFEGNELLLGILVFVALPRVTWQGKHLTVSLIDSSLSPRALRLEQTINSLISGAILTILGWYLWEHAQRLTEYGDMSNALRVPMGPLAYVISVLTFLSALAAILRPWYQKNTRQQG